MNQVAFLRYIISASGIQVNSKKVAEIENLEQPRIVIGIRSYPSLTSYHGRFVKDFSVIALSLTRLLRKEVKFEWDDNYE